MSLTFERGNPQEPRGHALVYFRAGSERVLALYVIVLPVSMGISKYIPPLLAPQFGGVSPQEMSAVALPPVPEEVGSYEELVKLAEMREDDLILGGTVLPSAEPTSLMEAANGAVQEYAQLWTDYLERTPIAAGKGGVGEEGVVGVSEVLYSLMGERDKLAEMSKLVSKLRFAVEGHDSAAAKETEEEIQILSDINIAMAVALDNGQLLAPVIFQADRKNIVEVAQEAITLTEQIRSRKFNLDILQGGTFTVSNAGMYGTDYVTPLINAPQSAALGVGRLVRKPAVKDDQIAILLHQRGI